MASIDRALELFWHPVATLEDRLDPSSATSLLPYPAFDDAAMHVVPALFPSLYAGAGG